MDEDELVLIILGWPFLATARAVIDVHEGKLSLRVGSETVTFNIRKSMKSKHSRDDYLYCADYTAKLVQEQWVDTVNHDVKWTKVEVEEDSNEVQAVSFYPRTEPVEPLEWKALENRLKPSSIKPRKLELKELPEHLKNHKGPIAWIITDIKGIESSFCTHKILMEDEFKPSVQPQRRVNPNIKEVVLKKGGMTVVKNKKNELIPKRMVTGWRMCIDYRKLNNTTQKDHFPIQFIIQMLERLAGLCNAPTTFQRYMTAIFHELIKDSMKVFMDDFSVFENSFDHCLKNHEKMLRRCEETNLLLNWKKCHFMVKPDWSLPFEVMCDVSDYAVGAMLGQKIDKHFKPIHYDIKTMNEAQENYTTTEKAFDKFQFDIKIRNKKGDENLATDHLSRLENPNLGKLTKGEIRDLFPEEQLMAFFDKNIEPCRFLLATYKELTTSRTPEKVLIREEAKFPVTKNVDSISLERGEEERSDKIDVATGNDIEKSTGTETGMQVKEAEKKNEAGKEEMTELPSSQPVEYYLKHSINEKLIEGLVDNHRFNDSLSGTRIRKTKGKTYNVSPRGPVYEAILRKKITRKEDIRGNFEIPCNIGGLKHMNSLVDQGSDVNVMPLSTYMKLTDERHAETDIRLSLASHSNIYPLGIAEDILLEVSKHVYPVDFVILDIKEDEKRPFILGTPFLTTAKAVIKFDKGTITLRSGKSKINFHRIPESLYKIERGVENDIYPIAPTMTIKRLVLEWEERIKLHLEREMKFDQ
ncbi:DNA-directed DNA polymerase [Tanacetum coccineum]